jgi:hypothetical protein
MITTEDAEGAEVFGEKKCRSLDSPQKLRLARDDLRVKSKEKGAG